MRNILNARAWDLAEQTLERMNDLRVAIHEREDGSRVLDYGVETKGSLEAGLTLAKVCTAGLASVSLTNGLLAGIDFPHVLVSTDLPIQACLLSQYAGWEIKHEKYHAMGSGPMRALARREPLFDELNYEEHFYCSVGVLEADKIPSQEVVSDIAAKVGVTPRNLLLLVAPTCSLAGSIQIVARSVETALHKLHELKFDLSYVRSAIGHAPLAPVAKQTIEGIGRTNDAILYGGRVTIYVDCEDHLIESIGPKVPSCSSEMYGKPFLELLKQANFDFYQIDPMLFSPAQVVMQNVQTGSVFVFGDVNEQMLRQSFGL